MTTANHNWAAVILAAGSGARAALTPPKQYQNVTIQNQTFPTIAHAINNLAPHVGKIQTVIAEEHKSLYDEATTLPPASPALLPPAMGGETRQQSAYNGLQALKKHKPKFVLIHDAARPQPPQSLIESLKDTAEKHGTAIPCLPVKDSICQTGNHTAEAYLDRDSLALVQTPQAFRFDMILEAHQAAKGDFTDDASLALAHGIAIHTIEGSERNIKLTTPQDFASLQGGQFDSITTTGFDLHATTAGDSVILGGIAIPCGFSLHGHSDADAVLHALCDAMLAVAGQGDIGTYFPPSDPQWQDADSAQFIAFAAGKLAEKHIAVRFVDVTLICEQPKIAPHARAMCENIAALLQIPPAYVAVKATTTERLGVIGDGNAIAAWVALTCRVPVGAAHG